MSRTTPAFDPTMRAIAQYLQAGLNTAGADYFSNIGQSNQAVVSSIRDWNADLKAVKDYPLLMVHRTGGDEITHQARIDYFLLYPVIELQPGILNWVRIEITRLLRRYDQESDGCIRIPEEFPINYNILPKQNEKQIYGLTRMTFSFQEEDEEM